MSFENLVSRWLFRRLLSGLEISVVEILRGIFVKDAILNPASPRDKAASSGSCK